MREIKNSHKLLMGATTVTMLAGIVSAGSYASWADAEASTQDVASGTFQLAVDGVQGENAVTLQAANFAPGDRVTRAITLSNPGSVDFGSIDMALSGTQSDGSQLLDGTAKGLQVRVLECDVPWIKSIGSSLSVDGLVCGTWERNRWGFHYFDKGDTEKVMDAAYDTATRTLAFSDLAHAEKAHLLVSVSLPATTGDGQTVNSGDDYAAYGDKTADITYTFTAKQREGKLVTGDVTDANLGS